MIPCPKRDLTGRAALNAAADCGDSEAAYLIRVGIHPSVCHCEGCDYLRSQRLIEDLQQHYGPMIIAAFGPEGVAK